MEDSENYLHKIDSFPLLKECFEPYIKWFCSNVEDNPTQYDLISEISAEKRGVLLQLENRLKHSQEILGISTTKFCTSFGFQDDLLVSDPEKIHDILGEPLFVIDLKECGFTSIQKIPSSINVNDKRTPAADFVADLQADRFAIELKIVRMGNLEEKSKPLTPEIKPYWWGQMFKSNVITKIEDKNRHALIQLENTSKHYGCNRQMLVIHSRRLGPSTLMSREDYVKVLTDIKNQYSQLNYLVCKDYFGMVVFCPELTVQNFA